MKFGFFVTNQYLPNQSMPQMIQESVEQVRLANQAGFDLICTGQHYMASPYQMSASLPLLARLAAESGSMEIAATVILIPLHNPVELAEYAIAKGNEHEPAFAWWVKFVLKKRDNIISKMESSFVTID